MRSDNKLQALSGMSTRQKATIGILIVVVLIVLWNVIGLFRGSKPATVPAVTTKTVTATNAKAVPPPMATPTPVDIIKPPLATPRELELMKLQQETQAKYISALNDLQMLKVSREIAEANQAIMTAKLATVSAQKNIVGLLTGPTPEEIKANYAKSLVNAAPAPVTPVVLVQPEVNYSVISVSQLRFRWFAVLGYGGNLYNATIGDILPPDRSKVISINKSGVVLERNGKRRRISLVPII